VYAATSAATGRELWISDLTPAGSFQLADLNVGPASSSPSQITVVGGRAFFVADDGVTGNELWVTDGTGTFLVADIEAGSGSSDPVSLVPFRDGVLFLATTTTFGREMWWSDGTAAGTVLLVDSVPGGGAGDISEPIVAGSRFAYFSSGVFGNPVTLYRTDGSTANTTVAVAGGSLAPMVPLGVFGNDLMLFAGDGLTGIELWSVDTGATAQTVGVPCGGARGGPRLAVPDPVLGSILTADGTNIVNGSFAFLMLGLPAATPFAVLGSDCWLEMEPGTISATGVFPVSAGAVQFLVPVPNLTALTGLRFVLQAAATPTPAPWGWDVTNGVAVTIGN
jgi:ELWxxDGT repeat protein